MKKLVKVIAVLALLNLGGTAALADDPQVSVTPDVQPNPEAPSSGGSATASGGSAGPATVSASDPVTVSSTTTPAPGAGESGGSTTASGPGTSANVPLGATTTEPDPSAPDGNAPETTTSGPSADADASRTTLTLTESGARAAIISNATGAFGASANGVGSAQDPTNASTCTTAEVTPGTPTDVSLGTACGSGPTTASEEFAASEANGSGAGGTPAVASCLGANASVGVSPSADIADACGTSGAASPATDAPAGTTGLDGNAATGSTGVAGLTVGSATQADAERQSLLGLLGLEGLPFTGTAGESMAYGGGLLGIAGLMALAVYLRRRIAVTWELGTVVGSTGKE